MKKIAIAFGILTFALILLGAIHAIDAAWIGPALAGLFGVQPVAKGLTPTREQRISNSVFGLMLAGAVIVGICLHAWPKHSQTRIDLDTLSAKLEQANRVGDAALATALLDEVTVLVRRMSGPGLQRECQVAGLHLSEAVVAISLGQPWPKRSQFEAAISDCK